jgi:hypothetical protein
MVVVCVKYLQTQPSVSEVDRQSLKYEVLTARVPIRPEKPDFSDQIEARYKALEESGQLPKTVMLGGMPAQPTRENILQQMRKEMEDRWTDVRPYEGREYVFHNVRVERGQDQVIFARFKIETIPLAPDYMYRPVFAFGDPRYGYFTSNLPLMRIDQFHTIPLPGECVAPDGTLQMTFINDPMLQKGALECTAYFEGNDGLEILYRVGGYVGNLVRTLAMLLITLMLFAAVGLMASTFLSFPVAVLLVLLIFFTGLMTDFLLEAVYYEGWQPSPDSVVGPLGYVLHPLSYFFVKFVPDLGNYDPIDTFAGGRNVSLIWIGKSLFYLLGLRGAVVAAVALVLFYRKELAEVIV